MILTSHPLLVIWPQEDPIKELGNPINGTWECLFCSDKRTFPNREGIAPFHIWVETKDYWTLLENHYQLSHHSTQRCGWRRTTGGSCCTWAPTPRTGARSAGSCCLLPHSARWVITTIKHHITIVNHQLIIIINHHTLTLIHHVVLLSSYHHYITKSCWLLLYSSAKRPSSQTSQIFHNLTSPGAPLWEGVCRLGQRANSSLPQRPHRQLGPQQVGVKSSLGRSI